MRNSDETTLNGAIAAAERVARNVIPDLAGRPLYIVQPKADSLITRQMLAGRSGQFYSELDLALQPQLEAECRWRGPGIAVIVDAWGCYVTADNDDDGLRSVVGTTLHEMGHACDFPEVTSCSADPYATFIRTSEAIAEQVTAPRQFSHAFLTHGESFIRICAHLWYRAAHGGGSVLRPEHLHFGNAYDGLEMLHTPATYVEALWPELKSKQSMSLRAVATTEQPAEFTQLWNDVLERIFLSAPNAA